MRAWIFSDLHLDVNRAQPYRLPDPAPAHDVVIIAGDVCEGAVRTVKWIAGVGLNKRPVLFVAGNHEFYRHDRIEELAAARKAAAKLHNVHLLERDSLEIGGLTILGATLWTDYELFGAQYAQQHAADCEQGIVDHRLIRLGGKAWRAADAAAEHAEARQWLTEQLDTLGNRKIVVITHHAPSIKSVAERFARSSISAGFASDCEDLAARAALWVHGHCHNVSDYRLGSCRVVANPRGYGAECPEFDAGLVVEI